MEAADEERRAKMLRSTTGKNDIPLSMGINLTWEQKVITQEVTNSKYNPRLITFFLTVIISVIYRFSLTENMSQCVQDRIQDLFTPITNYLLENPENFETRNLLQAICSGMMDLTFFGTYLYWILYGRSFRLIFTMGLFYITRGIVQKLYLLPFPVVYWWDSPGVPSLAVPYGRGSDFFYSGHSGFLLICSNEWGINQKPLVKYVIRLFLCYTMFILAAYHVHYSMDMFVAVIYADWCFYHANNYRERLDRSLRKVFAMMKSIINKFLKAKRVE